MFGGSPASSGDGQGGMGNGGEAHSASDFCRDAARRGIAKRAFTLIELLVVIAIIASLHRDPAPRPGQARAARHQTVCLANLSQLGQTVPVHYQAANKGYFPGHHTQSPIYIVWPPRLRSAERRNEGLSTARRCSPSSRGSTVQGEHEGRVWL